MKLFKHESSNAKWNAQRSLTGLTHYVDDDTLRFHKSRILSSYITDGGLLFSIIESVGLDMNNTKRGFRFVIFDVFGTVIARPDLENCAGSRNTAVKWMWDALNKIDAKAHTAKAIEQQRASFARECDEMVDILRTLEISPRKAA